jgi:N-acetyl-anhydromuramyl-L-alanine amidase AmpD
MKGSEFVSSISGVAGCLRESQILQAIRAGATVPIVWTSIESRAVGHVARLQVSSDALAVGEPDDFTRVTVSHTTAQSIADHFDAILPTTRISDLTFQAADVRLKPCLQTPDAGMANTSRMVQHSEAVEAKRAGRTGLISTVGKDWVVTNRLVGHPNRAANYGWHDSAAPNKKCWQPLGLAHDRWHVDYSQVVRLVRRQIEVDGAPRDIVDVLGDPALAALVSDEGPIRFWRLAAVPEPRPGVSGLPSKEIPPSAPLPATPRTLRRGCSGDDVAAWQRFLGIGESGTFDDVTEEATRDWQARHGLVADGVVGPKTRAAAKQAPPPALPSIPFVQARNYTPVGGRKIKLVVIHTMEAFEKPDTAENVATWLAGTSAPKASVHYCVDADSIVQCVKDGDVAWHAPGANSNGIGIEHAGYARQSAEDWADSYSEATLVRSAALTAKLCSVYGIPVQAVDADGLVRGESGITTHRAVSTAFKKSTHTDPGPHFPMDQYVSLVRAAF